jgi:vitamin B12 transporter
VFKITFVWIFCGLAFGIVAQQADTLKSYQLSEVSVETSRLSSFNTGSKIVTFDSTTLKRFQNGQLSDLLAQQNFLLVKSYSPGNLATIGFRGTSANHTAVLWNGFNIQSSMNGQSDLALLPVNFMNNVRLQFGGGGALFGSGAVGGTIHLNNVPVFGQGLIASANASIASFRNYQENVSVELSQKRWISSLKIFNRDVKNDYTFINEALLGRPQMRQQNAAIKMVGLLSENYFKIGKDQIINLRYWGQYADRQIPPTLLAGNKNDYQQDETHRVSAEWQKNGYKAQWFIRSGLFSEKINYGRPGYDTASNRATNIISEAETRIRLDKNYSFNVGLNNTYSFATGINLNRPELNRYALFGSFKSESDNKDWSASINFREQLSERGFAPLMPSLGVEGKLYKELLSLRANVTRNYRLPTLNDLYWRQQGAKGNANLQPESGWSEDLGLNSTINYQKSTINLSATAFNSNIDNWIYWCTNLQGILTPENIQSVWARGLELMGKWSYTYSKDLTLMAQANYDYTVSTVEKSDQANLIGKQLIYVPYEKAFFNIGFAYKRLVINYNHAFTGFRYSQEDNLAYLPAFSVGNINLNYQLLITNYQLSLFAQLNNLWSESYQVLASRPMPLFNFQTGLTIHFHKPLNSKP